MSPAPVAVFAGARPERARAVLESLCCADGAAESTLTIFCDAPRNSTEATGAREVGRLAKAVSGFRRADVVEARTHEGRSRQIIDGVSRLLREHDRVIVVEDDLVVSPGFLRFVNDGLERYAGEERVASVCGSSFSLRGGLPETFFLPGAHAWGWGTWRRAWAPMRFDPEEQLRELLDRDLVYAFDTGGAEPLTQALQDAIFAGVMPWTLCWMASAIVAGQLTLYPGRALAVNVGARGPAVASVFDTPLGNEPVHISESPVAANEEVLLRLRTALMQWRCGRSRAFHGYVALARLLPRELEMSLYSALIRRKLQRNARRRAPLLPSGSTG